MGSGWVEFQRFGPCVLLTASSCLRSVLIQVWLPRICFSCLGGGEEWRPLQAWRSKGLAWIPYHCNVIEAALGIVQKNSTKLVTMIYLVVVPKFFRSNYCLNGDHSTTRHCLHPMVTIWSIRAART